MDVIRCMNNFQAEEKDYLFAINFDKTLGFCLPLDEINTEEIKYSLNFDEPQKPSFPIQLSYNSIHYDDYLEVFNKVKNQLEEGNSYLCNLTFRTPITCNLELLQIFAYANAKYKLWVKDQFVVFSPESFVQIKDNVISTFPMKGTIDADIENAEEIIMSSKKEQAEHNTIVDLLRNDLSIVANDVTVKRYRYSDIINTHNGKLLQLSSEITGHIKLNYKNSYGNLIDQILPAGSISGAPKRKTLEIIHNIELTPRNFYTGIFGVYNKGILDSAVMIRYIEKNNNQLYFRSGGGIQILSDPLQEYEEMKSKIYVPIF